MYFAATKPQLINQNIFTVRFSYLLSELDNALGEAKIIKDELVVSGLDVLQDRLETPLSPEGRRDQPGLAHGHQTGHPGYPAASVVHSHWSSSDITALSLVESFPSDAGASSLMP